jgi:hypothetical protein
MDTKQEILSPYWYRTFGEGFSVHPCITNSVISEDGNSITFTYRHKPGPNGLCAVCKDPVIYMKMLDIPWLKPQGDSMTVADLENWFTYHAPSDQNKFDYQEIRNAGLALAKTILEHTPSCADQTAAIRKVREAVFCANASIACGGK